jgi:hypothetical protein
MNGEPRREVQAGRDPPIVMLHHGKYIAKSYKNRSYTLSRYPEYTRNDQIWLFGVSVPLGMA